MCQVSPKRPHLDALMDVLQLKEHFGTLTFSFFFFLMGGGWHFGGVWLSVPKPARAPASCVWFFRRGLN